MTKKFYHPTAQLTDEVSLDVLQKENPRLVIAIQNLINEGATADSIERRFRGYGTVGLLVAGAAHRIEWLKKNPQEAS